MREGPLATSLYERQNIPDFRFYQKPVPSDSTCCDALPSKSTEVEKRIQGEITRTTALYQDKTEIEQQHKI